MVVEVRLDGVKVNFMPVGIGEVDGSWMDNFTGGWFHEWMILRVDGFMSG